MIGNNSSRASIAAEDTGRSTIRVRNIREMVVYHLMFDGDIGRLTGALLKQHVQSICGVPVEQQILTFNNFHVSNETTGYDLGLHDGCTLLLDTLVRSQKRQGSVSGAAAEDAYGAVRGSSTGGTSAIAAPMPPSGRGAAPSPVPNHVPRPSTLPPATKSRFEREMESLRRDDDGTAGLRQPYYENTSVARGTTYAGPAASGLNASSSVFNPHHHGSSHLPMQLNAYPATGLYDDVDVDVEITEESGAPLWQPSNSIDVEESRLLQQDYIWKMEQVRFETERMNREREMLRQKQELDYQAELLERERIDLERKTHGERLKYSTLQATLHDEMAIEAKVSAMTEESVYRSRFQ